MNFRFSSAATKIERESSGWVIRCERGLTAAEQDEFHQWLAADPRHGHAFALQRGNWDRLALLADWRPEHGATPNRDLLAPSPNSWIPRERRRWRWLAPVALAAAAAVALGLFFGWTARQAPSAAVPATLIAPIAQRTLPDGSTVILNRGAEISVRYTSGERRIRLERGEAHFEVTPAPGRPFIVSARGIDVRAVGTAFNIRIDSAAVDVLVTAGRVELRSPSPDAAAPRNPAAPSAPNYPTISAGHRSVIPVDPAVGAPAIAPVTEEQMGELLAWRPSPLDFTDTPLQSVVAEFNRRNAPVKIEIADSSLAQLEVSASLRSDNIEGFIRLLELGFGVEAVRSGNLVQLRRTKTAGLTRAR